ncbi:very long chain fatty acid elongase 7-like [Lycorma delicatula]|uniref:very long chain fatty acid elongase 7-like n=1 Tax=Lycorma delicatula TaxID=130591 RepID=UPI003F50E7D0
MDKIFMDDLVNNMFMMNSPWPVSILIACYLYFVTRLGPKYMANKKPYKLKELMILYNLGQVVANAWFLYWIMQKDNIIPFLLKQSCFPDPTADITMRAFAFRASWIWLMTKISDLLDTVIFVLRKKHSQITFLHLYHHTSMVLSVWLYIKYVRGEQGIFVGLVNSVVHVVMYSYYLLSALGPSIQPYLWWKRYITKLQLAQFVILMTFFGTLLCRCDVPLLQKIYNTYAVSQGITFIFMFSNFYIKSYLSSKKQNKISTD